MSTEQLMEVVFPYTATDKNQLTLKGGNAIKVVQSKPDALWAIGSLQSGPLAGTVGLFLVAYCRPLRQRATFNVPAERKASVLDARDLQAGSPKMRPTTANPASPTMGSRRQSMASAVFSPRASEYAIGRSNAAKSLASLGFDDDDDDDEGDDGFDDPERNLVFDKVTTARKMLHVLERDVKKLKHKKAELARRQKERDADINKLQRQSDLEVADLKAAGARAVDLQNRLAVLQALFLGEDVPDYASPAHGSLDASPMASSLDVDPPKAKVEPMTADDVEAIADDKVRKLVRKFAKRLDESAQLLGEYESEQKKLEKKGAKYDARIKAAETELEHATLAMAAEMSGAAAQQASEIADATADKTAAANALADLQEKELNVNADIAKLKKKLDKGDKKLTELGAELAELKAWKAGSDEELAGQKTRVRAALMEAEACDGAVDALRAKLALDRDNLVGDDAHLKKRVVIEHQRIADIDKDIAKVKAAQAAEAEL
jgi:hypothetical protein